MKVTVRIDIDMPNPEQWRTAFGSEVKDIRADVKEYVGNGMQGIGVFGNGEVDATITWR